MSTKLKKDRTRSRKNFPRVTSLYPPVIRVNPDTGDVFAIGSPWVKLPFLITVAELRVLYWDKVVLSSFKPPIPKNVYKVSSSDKSKEYDVEIGENNHFSCTCTGYSFRRSCSHIDKIKMQLNIK